MYSKEMIQEFVDQTIVQTIQPEKVILFGSYAYGKPNDKSDIDLLVIKNGRDITELYGDMGVKMIEVDVCLNCDVLIMTDEDVAEEMKHNWSVVYKAMTEGRVLYERYA